MQQLRLTYNRILLGMMIPVMFLLPYFSCQILPFKMEPSDCLLPFVTLGLAGMWKSLGRNLKWILTGGGISMWILATILINRQAGVVSNYFEIYKILKYFCFFLFVKEVLSSQFTEWKSLRTSVEVFTLALLIFNLLHYFNIGDFNHRIMPYYCDNDNLTYFGLYREGIPGPKRMIGVMGNPNYNALVFNCLLIWFRPRNHWDIRSGVMYFLCLVAMLCCQSRTNTALFAVIIIGLTLLEPLSWKKRLACLSGTFLVIILVMNWSSLMCLLGGNPENSMSYVSSTKTSSLSARFQIWESMISRMDGCWIWGHSPDKQYFTEHHLHPDNEYVAFLYRYGIVGLLGLSMLYILMGLKGLMSRKANPSGLDMAGISVLYAGQSLMAEPLMNTRAWIPFIFFLALFAAFEERNKLKDIFPENQERRTAE